MHKKVLSLLTIIPLTILLCGAKKSEPKKGYEGQLPDIVREFKLQLEQIEKEAPVIPDLPEPPKVQEEINVPLAPNIIPSEFSNSILNQSRYAEYLKDIDEIIPTLEKIQQSLKNQDSLQNYSAGVRTFGFKLDYLEKKYKNSSESRYSSFHELEKLNKDLINFLNYWSKAEKYINYVSNYESRSAYSPATINEMREKTLYRLNDALINIKEARNLE